LVAGSWKSALKEAAYFHLTASFPTPLIHGMSTLGLSGPPQQEEGLFKRLLWPSVRNAHDVNLLGQQGFWICEGIAVLSAIFLIFTQHPILAAMTFIFYALGGFGLREGSVAAAGLVFAAWTCDQIASIVTHRGGIGIVQLVVAAILLANLRGTVMAAGWKKRVQPGEEDIEPMRFSETLVDKFRDQWPRRTWPALRYVFYVFAVGFVAIELLGAVALVLHPERGLRQTLPDAVVSGP
jgi:hypothetical protein